VQKIGGLLNDAIDAFTCGGMTGEGQCPDERGRAYQRHAAPPRRSGEGKAVQRQDHQHDQHGSRQPDIAEVGVEQYRPDDAFGPHGGERALAHLRRQQDEPSDAGEHGQGKAEPDNAGEPPANHGGDRLVGRSDTKCRLADE
jgi:hypothetical protein